MTPKSKKYALKVRFLAPIILISSLLSSGTALAGPSSYLWSTSNNSPSSVWTNVTSNSSGQYLAADIGYISGDIYTSNDYGTTWTDQTASGSRNWQGITSDSTGQYVAAAAYSGYIYTSSDYGVDWTAQTASGIQNWVAISSSASGKYISAVANNGDIFVSTDYGVGWSNASTANPATQSLNWYGITENASGKYQAAGAFGTSIYVSDNYGATWTAASGTAGGGWYGLTTSASGRYMTAINQIDSDIWSSDNYGLTWTDDTTNESAHGQVWHAVTSSATGQYQAAAVNGGDIWTSNDFGATWSNATQNTAVSGRAFYAIAMNADGSRIVAGSNSSDLITGINSAVEVPTSAVLTNVVTNQPIVVTTPTGSTGMTCASSTTESSLAKADTGYTYPLGLVNVCFWNVTPSNQVSLVFVTNLSPQSVVARDYNSLTNTYQTIPGAVITQTSYGGNPALQLTYDITPDDGLNSSITANFTMDPVGLAQVVVSSSKVVAPDTGFGTAHQAMNYVAVVLGSLSILVGIGYTKRRSFVHSD